MLHEALATYLEKVEQTVLQCRSAYVERYMNASTKPSGGEGILPSHEGGTPSVSGTAVLSAGDIFLLPG